MGALAGDYIGFTFNGVHSSSLGIVRVSDGSRFNENLLPTMQDKTIQVPGGDGAYYFGSYYTQRPFNVAFAFDSLTQTQIDNLKRVFGDKQVHDLIFDETPYKVYSAKVTGSATIKYLAFNEGKGKERVYKGEGNLQITCYWPFARCPYVTKDKYNNDNFPGMLYNKETGNLANIDEWWEASGIERGGNFGDIPVPFTLDLTGEGSFACAGETIAWNLGKKSVTLEDGTITLEDRTGTLDTRTGLVKDENGEILNKYITKGNTLMKIPVGVGATEGDFTLVNCSNLEYTCYYL